MSLKTQWKWFGHEQKWPVSTLISFYMDMGHKYKFLSVLKCSIQQIFIIRICEIGCTITQPNIL